VSRKKKRKRPRKPHDRPLGVRESQSKLDRFIIPVAVLLILAMIVAFFVVRAVQ